MEQCQEILRKTKANPINNSTWKVIGARRRGRKALMTAEGALEREWDIGEKIQVHTTFPDNLATVVSHTGTFQTLSFKAGSIVLISSIRAGHLAS